MMKCPACSKITPLQARCSHCHTLIRSFAIERFDRAAEAVENALKKELLERKKNKQVRG